jgi:hypothetical protein
MGPSITTLRHELTSNRYWQQRDQAAVTGSIAHCCAGLLILRIYFFAISTVGLLVVEFAVEFTG